MGVSIEIKARFTIECDYKWGGGYSTAQKYGDPKNHECSEGVEIDGFVVVQRDIEVSSVPSNHDIIEGVSYDLPEGWDSRYNGRVPRCDIVCPECLSRLDK